jgi:transposase
MNEYMYKQGIARQQGYLLPPSIEEYVSKDNPIRAIDSYVESLDLRQLGFENSHRELAPGQPAYSPQTLLKLYLYGYLHRIRSSRRLEAECLRNLEVIWLLEGLKPGYKTIADFRKNNLKALKKVNQDFVQLCKELDLFGAELVGIDGSFFRGNVAKGSIYTAERLRRALKQVEQDIAKYLNEMEHADQQEEQDKLHDPELAQKLAQLRERQQKRTQQLKQLEESGATQIAEVDEDARLLHKGSQTVAGYNVQAAVDDKNKLLVTCEATQDGNDEQQLAPMSQAAKVVLGVEKLEAVADEGYFSGPQIKTCGENGITPYVPEPDKTSQARLQGRFERNDFSYDEAANCYTCPAGKTMKYGGTQVKRGKTIWFYRSCVTDCAACPLKAQCLPAKTPFRKIARWEHEQVLEAHRARMAGHGAEMMHLRAGLCEHPFGTLKLWCGWTHFLMRGLEKVRAELSLLMLSYNFKRVLNIIGLTAFRAYCLTRRLNQPVMNV